MKSFRTVVLLCGLLTLRLATAQPLDGPSPRLPQPGDVSLRLLTPSYLEITTITAPPPDTEAPFLAHEFHLADFKVEVDGHAATADTIGFKRRPVYAPLLHRDLRVATEIYLHLATPIDPATRHQIIVTPRSKTILSSSDGLKTTDDPDRFSPVIHVNQEGYMPDALKLAMVGYYIGTLGELPIPTDSGFDVVDAASGRKVFHGTLTQRRDIGFTLKPPPYQSVFQADFTALKTPGEYRIVVPGLGASFAFRIDDGELMNFTRAYALGLFEQRCGFALELPFTRFTHAACHTAPAEVPMPPEEFPKAWDIIRKLDEGDKSDHPEQQLKYPEDQLYPFQKLGRVDVSGGHHDAGDYSKYTTNSALLIHPLIFAVDSFPGVADLDNLGIPESGDGIPDLLEEAKWEADFLAKLQDEDGGFYFLVYPKDREYETDVLPDHGDPQIVWPKTTTSTASAVAALAQCASSPVFKKYYPEDAKRYLAEAERGWKFLIKAIATHGREKAYQRLTHYGDEFADTDELAWAACEMFLATGDRAYEDKLREWFPDPTDPRTRQYGWRRASFCYGNAMRSYAFAASSGRLPRNQLDAAYLEKCEAELRRAGEDATRWSEQNAYGSSFPDASKRFNMAGWYFSSDQAFDITVAYQLEHRGAFADAVIENLNYEGGCNPVNMPFITGLGQRRQHEIVDQYAENDERVLPPSGIPIGNIASAYTYLGPYKLELRDETWPREDGTGPQYPMYDRWTDMYNLNTEFVVPNQARSLASLAFWAAQTPLKTQPWRAAKATIEGRKGVLPLRKPVRFRLACPDLDLSRARIVWEGSDQQPAFGPTFDMVPQTTGPQWVEAEADLPDGRRVFARATFTANAPTVIWFEGALPRGATPVAQGGDSWKWIKPIGKPPNMNAHARVLQHESALADGIHEHGFYDAADTLTIDPGDVLFAFVWIDPEHIPDTIMLDFNDGTSGQHRAFWGRNEIPWGKMNTDSQRPMGPIPPAGKWVRLDVPARLVGLEGKTLHGMSFRLKGGRAIWDAVGKLNAAAAELGFFHPPPPPK